MIVPLVVLLVAIAVLVKSADYFTDASEKLAVKIGISPFIVGATIASIGTSVPELFTSIFSIINGSPAAITIVLGNAIGSNIANITLVLGAAGIAAKQMNIRWDLIKIDIPLLSAATFYLWLAAADGIFTAGEGALAILLYGVYFAYTLQVHKKKHGPKARHIRAWDFVELGAGLVGVLVGAHYCVESVLQLAGGLAIPAAVIAASAVALGTSLPELAVSVQAALKKKYELAIGNVTGSCIFNALVVTGLPSLFVPLTAGGTIQSLGLPFLLATAAMFVVVAIDKKVSSYEGYALVALYILFIAKLFGLF